MDPETRDRVLRALGLVETRHPAKPPHEQWMHGRRGPNTKKAKVAAQKAADAAEIETPRKPAKKATPRVARSHRERQLARWRADARKPGRVLSGKTKRQSYIESWDRGIASHEKDLARERAKSYPDPVRIQAIRDNLAYYRRNRRATVVNTDPSLDEPEGAGGKPAIAVDPKRPLAVYGDMLHLDGQDDDWTHTALTELERIPAEFHGLVAEGMAGVPEGGLWIGEGGVHGLDGAGELADEQPRGWKSGQTFKEVDGVYRPGRRQVLVGRTANSEFRPNTVASHEFGHALDHALDTPSARPEWERIHARVVAETPALSPYFKQTGQAGREEFWSEAFSAWVAARQPDRYFGHRAAYITQLNVGGALADAIHDYFERLARQHGV